MGYSYRGKDEGLTFQQGVQLLKQKLEKVYEGWPPQIEYSRVEEDTYIGKLSERSICVEIVLQKEL